jgi:hypothetical protein
MPLLEGLPEALESLQTSPPEGYTVTRRATGAVVRGRVTPGAPTTFPVHGALVPLQGRDLMRMPEGMRTVERRILYTRVQLYSGPTPDVVAADGGTWEVEGVEDYSATGGFWRCTVVRQGD